MVRSLTDAEKERFRAALAALHAAPQPGEPIDRDALYELRERNFVRDFPDVAELIGCIMPPLPRVVLVRHSDCKFCSNKLLFEALSDGLIRYHHEAPVCSDWVDAMVELCGELPADETNEVLLVDATQQERSR